MNSCAQGIIQALKEYRQKLIDHKVSIWVRRAGPNYQEGLRMMRELGETLGVPLHVFGPETHMTAIVTMALGIRELPQQPLMPLSATANFLLFGGAASRPRGESFRTQQPDAAKPAGPSSTLSVAGAAGEAGAGSGSRHTSDVSSSPRTLFGPNSKAVVWGLQTRAVQGMLDFDYACRRKEPSVVAMTYPMVNDHKIKFYWGLNDILIPGAILGLVLVEIVVGVVVVCCSIVL